MGHRITLTELFAMGVCMKSQKRVGQGSADLRRLPASLGVPVGGHGQGWQWQALSSEEDWLCPGYGAHASSTFLRVLLILHRGWPPSSSGSFRRPPSILRVSSVPYRIFGFFLFFCFVSFSEGVQRNVRYHGFLCFWWLCVFCHVFGVNEITYVIMQIYVYWSQKHFELSKWKSCF